MFHSTATPLLFAELLSFWSVESTMSRETASYYAIAMIASNWLGAYLNHHGNLYCQQYGMKLRVATGSLMFRKVRVKKSAQITEFWSWFS